MGQVITSAEMRRVVDANLHSYIEQMTQSYSRLFGKSPMFVTYYSQDTSESYLDANLGGAIQIIGPESPIKFRAIDDFPLYGFPEADVSSAYEDVQGIVSNAVRGEVYILPHTIEPCEDDFFTISYLETQIVFRILSANPDRIEGKSYFKIEYILDHVELSSLKEQISSSWTFELGTIGTDANPLVEKDVAILLREMEVIEEHFRQSYWKAFYDRNSGSLVLRSGVDKPLHDRAVSMFVQRNNLLGGTGYMKARSVQVPEYDDRGLFEEAAYPMTIYWQSERSKWTGQEQYTTNRFFQSEMTSFTPSSPFFYEFALSGYYEAVPSPVGNNYAGGETLVEDINNGITTDAIALRSLAKKCLLDDGFPEDKKAALREFNELLNNASLIRDRRDQFWLMPVVLMRAKRFREQARANN